MSAWHTRIWVPDIAGTMFPEATTHIKLLEEFRTISGPDGVHLTDEGYRKWADSIITFLKEKSVLVGRTATKPNSFFWRGFVSPVGSERPTNHASFHTNRSAGGGKWSRDTRVTTRGRGGHSRPEFGRTSHGRPPYTKKKY